LETNKNEKYILVNDQGTYFSHIEQDGHVVLVPVIANANRYDDIHLARNAAKEILKKYGLFFRPEKYTTP
jgi:hypothetical protein